MPLHGMLAVGAQALDGRDGFAVRHVDRRQAGAHSLAIEMDGAGPADADTTAELGARETDFVSQEPEQRHARIATESAFLSVDGNICHGLRSLDFRP